MLIYVSWTTLYRAALWKHTHLYAMSKGHIPLSLNMWAACMRVHCLHIIADLLLDYTNATYGQGGYKPRRWLLARSTFEHHCSDCIALVYSRSWFNSRQTQGRYPENANLWTDEMDNSLRSQSIHIPSYCLQDKTDKHQAKVHSKRRETGDGYGKWAQMLLISTRKGCLSHDLFSQRI